MKSMHFHQRPDNRSSSRLLVLGSIFLCAVFAVGVAWLRPAFLSQNLLEAVTPLMGMQESGTSALASVFSIFASKGSLTAENKSLKEENVLLKARNEALEAAITSYRSQLRITPKTEQGRWISVIGTPGLAPYDVLILEAGENDGITIGNTVSFGNIPLGTISEVYERNSKVTLYSMPGEEVPVLLAGNDFLLSAQGQGGGMFKVLLPRTVTVRIGDSFILPSQESGVIGSAAHIIRDDVDAFQTILFSYPLNIHELRRVLITP